MNQILQVQEKKKIPKSNPIDTKKIVLFFAVALIIFGSLLVIQGIVNRVNTTKVDKQQNEQLEPPSIKLTQLENKQLSIQIKSSIPISHIIYNWNENASETLQENGKTIIDETVAIPVGENTFYISVIDEKGNVFKNQATFTIDETKPNISLYKVGNDIKIVVTSSIDLSSVTYKWNSEEATKIDMYTYEDKTKLEKVLEIPTGQNTIKIEALDINGNSAEKSLDIKASKKSKTQAIVKGAFVEISITSEDNIKEVEFELNGKKYKMNTTTFGETKNVFYKLPLSEGKNYLKVVSTTVEDAVDKSLWVHEYSNNIQNN